MLESHVASGCGLPMCRTNRHHEALTFLQDSCCSHRVKVGEAEESMASEKLPPGTIPWFSTNSGMLCTYLEFSGAVSAAKNLRLGTLYALQPLVGRKRGWQEGSRGGKEKTDKITSGAALNQNGSLGFPASSVSADMWG